MQSIINRGGWVIAGLVSLVALAALAGIVHGGPLDPPGAPASTSGVLRPGTPITSLPFTISQPGNYYLTSNLTMATTGAGITINVSDVTLDLGGFTMDGAHVGNLGVYIPSQFNGFNLHSITVRNGMAQNWTGAGFEFGAVDTLIADGLQANNNQTGIDIENGTLTHCAAFGNSAAGVEARATSITDCTAKNNQGNGFSLTDYSELRTCTATGNAPADIDAFASTVDGCTVNGGTYGITVGFNSQIRNNAVSFTDSDGIRLASPSGSGDSLITENTVADAGGQGLASGIYVQTGNNLISRNHVTVTNGPGINVVGSFNTIDENSTLTNTGIGIVVGGSKNTVVHNNSLGNVNTSSSTNYQVGAGNNYGGVTAAASGTNPWSNTQ